MILINSAPRNPVKLFQPFTPIYVPVGIGYLLAAADRERIKAVCVDEQIESDIAGAVERAIRSLGEQPPYLFGFSVLTAAFGNAVRLARTLKEKYPSSVVCFGGIHPTAAPEEVLSYPSVDVVLKGEGERTLPELYRCVKDRRDITHIAGLSFRRGSEIIHNPLPPVLEDLDSLPFPYDRFDERRYDLGFVVTSRGCPHACIFCSNRVTTGKRYRVRSADAIVAELDMLRHKYGKRQILFVDDNLLVNKHRIQELLDAIRMRGLHRDMHFSFQARGDNVDPDILKRLHAAGFRSVFFGLETSSERIMKLIRKGETVAQCAAAVRMAKDAGMHVSATFIYALPTETHADRMKCVDMSRELGLDMVRFNNATPYPGTELFRIARREERLYVRGLYENFSAVSTFVENPFDPIPFSYVPEGNSENEIRRDILFSYFSYYLDIARLKFIFSRPELGVRWFSAGERLRDVLNKIPALAALSLLLLFKFGQLFHYSVLKRDTRRPLGFFLQAFQGLLPGKRKRIRTESDEGMTP